MGASGEVRVDVIFENENDIVLSEAGHLEKKEIRNIKLDALVDTGAVMVLLPQDAVEALGVKILGKTIVTLANEEKVELSVSGQICLTIGGRKWATDCLVGPPRCEPLIGQLVMERLDLIVDPLKQTITPRPESPFLPCLKLK